MGEEPTSLLEAAVELSRGPADGAFDAAPAKRPTRRSIAILVVGALVIAGGAIGGTAWANQVAHDQARADADAAHVAATRAVVAHEATVAWLETSVASGIETRDAVVAQVLPHQDLLGGAGAVEQVAASETALATTLSEVVGVDSPTSESPIAGAVIRDRPAPIDPTMTTDELTALALELGRTARATDADRVRTAARADDIDAAMGELGADLDALASNLPAVYEALIASRTLASADAKAAGATALAALADAPSDAALPQLFSAYATAASGVIATHDAEAARIAAEAARVAAEQAAKKARGSSRSSGGGSVSGGGGGTEQRGVLSETNAQRAANGLGALAWNGTLASRSCAFAAELASKNGGLYHSSFAGGFSAWGENVAYGYGSASAVVAGWMGSSGHRANILGSYTMMGACSAASATGRIYWVQQFGR